MRNRTAKREAGLALVEVRVAVRAAGVVIVPRALEGMAEGVEVEVLLYDEGLPA